MERPAAVGPTSQSIGRPKQDNGNSRMAHQTTNNRRPPKLVRSTMSNSSLSSQVPISAAQFVTLAREAMKNALEENQTKAAEAKSVSDELKPGVTIDLSHKQIQRFPDEVVDIIKNELERLALSHNQLTSFPSRFYECKSLRYLNVRNNLIREFPQCICELSSLEILDFGRNKLKSLPPQIVKLTSLKVLSVQKNRIDVLPLCLADMGSLQVLKLDGNPIRFPPKEILHPHPKSPVTGYPLDTDFDEPTITLHIKRFLKQKQIADRSDLESGVSEPNEGAENQRPMKRVISGRFPIKVNGSEVSDVRSPALARPPPIPSRSHYRGLSQQNSGMRRSGVMPLTIGNANERIRSNSDVILQPVREQRVFSQFRRMGAFQKKASELGTVDESKTNRNNHYRGLSHGSAMTGNSIGRASSFKSPVSPADSITQRTTYVRRLSSLPEHKRELVSPDPDVEAAKSILYALFQVHPLIQSLLGVARDVTSKRTSLERVFYNASTHVEELDKTIQDFMMSSGEDENGSTRSSENVRHACVTCVNAYIHVLNLLQSNVNPLIENGDPRYIRTLLLLLYGSTCEVYAAHMSFLKKGRTLSRKELGNTVKSDDKANQSNQKEKAIALTHRKTNKGFRLRSATVVHGSAIQHSSLNYHPFPFQGEGRSATASSINSREAYASPSSALTLSRVNEFTEEDNLFEKIFLRLQQSLEITTRAIPFLHSQFLASMKISNQQSYSDQPKKIWQLLIHKCLLVAQNAEILKYRISSIKLKEPGIRTQSAFWELCYNFINAFSDLLIKVKDAMSITPLLNKEVLAVLRPLHKSIKDTAQLIQSSPWSSLVSSTSSGVIGSRPTKPRSQKSVPTTPVSTALGSISHSSTTSTNQNVSNGFMLTGNVFERADALLSMNGSVASSRNNMTSSLGSTGSTDNNIPTPVLTPANSFSSKYKAMGKVILS
ncbi:hypothetical protein GcM3_032026 [Golovinomyces cichoracearum]|uniref:Disease resistance R13L4/SHOC-2-like LRR domain-containing protein n=1 Tax=Golovinomyces cichoracearum TaxID=62708 RepID=A0A420J4I8_9PEZI|nr:hypothetical protein GcM3_032026 [Golovinomyces cichoracearum]